MNKLNLIHLNESELKNLIAVSASYNRLLLLPDFKKLLFDFTDTSVLNALKSFRSKEEFESSVDYLFSRTVIRDYLHSLSDITLFEQELHNRGNIYGKKN